MIDHIIAWSSRYPVLSFCLLILATASGALASFGLYALISRWLSHKTVALVIGTGIDLLLVGAIVTAANEAYLHRLENRTRDAAAKLSAILSTEASLAAAHAQECRSASQVIGLMTLIQSNFPNSRIISDRRLQPYYAYDPEFRYTNRPTHKACDAFQLIAERARHANSIIPQLIDSATNPSEQSFLWQKVESMVGLVESHMQAWSDFTAEHLPSRTGFSGTGGTQHWFDMLVAAYTEQRETEATSLPKGLWEILGYLALVLKLGEAWWTFAYERREARLSQKTATTAA